MNMSNSIQLGLQISEAEYRNIPVPSYSYLADMGKAELEKPGSSIDIVKYGVKREGIVDLLGVIIGTIVDSNITDGKNPDNLIVIEKKPTGKMLGITRAFVSGKYLLPNSTDILAKINDDSINDICEVFKYKKKYKDRVDGFRNYEEYVETLDKYQDPYVVSKYEFNIAMRTLKSLRKEYPFLSNPKHFNLEMLSQVKLKGIVHGQECKGMLDMVFINHSKKVIVPFDLKTGRVEHSLFFEGCYLGWLYYIQAALYRRLLMLEILKHPILKDYTILPFRFMYCGRSDFKPIIYEVSNLQDMMAMEGFKNGSISYPGVESLLDIYKKVKLS